jgi:hypothetical protein
VDTIRIHPAGDPFSARQSEPTARCTGCRQRFSRRALIVVHEGMDDKLIYFHGDKLCRPCARRNGVCY